MREAATPLLDGVARLPYAALGAIHADPRDPMPAVEQGILLKELPAAAAEAFTEVTAGLPLAVAEIRQLGGAVARPSGAPAAAPGRDAAFAVHAIAVPFVPGGAEAVEEVVVRMAPWSTGGALPNFAGTGAEPAARIRRAFGPVTAARLDTLRARVDPTGRFAPAARWA
jgi:hypothetical protein